MSGAAIGLQAAGTGLSAYSGYQQGLAQDRYYRYLSSQKRVEEGLVQEQADQESTSAQTEGAFQSKIAQRKNLELEGTQSTAEAANGISGSVTAADIAKDTFDKSKMDQLAIKYNADLATWRTQNNAKLKKYALEEEAKNDEIAGENARKSGKLNAISSLLGGSAQVASSLYRFKQSAPTK